MLTFTTTFDPNYPPPPGGSEKMVSDSLIFTLTSPEFFEKIYTPVLPLIYQLRLINA